MEDGAASRDNQDHGDVLRGTTLQVYRFLYRRARPTRLTEVQKGLGMSSASLAQYHLRKLQDAGLIHEKGEGYVVDKIIFENMVRIRSAVVPFRITYSAFFATTLALLLTVFRPALLTQIYAIAIIVNVIALGIFVYESLSVIFRNLV